MVNLPDWKNVWRSSEIMTVYWEQGPQNILLYLPDFVFTISSFINPMTTITRCRYHCSHQLPASSRPMLLSALPIFSIQISPVKILALFAKTAYISHHTPMLHRLKVELLRAYRVLETHAQPGRVFVACADGQSMAISGAVDVVFEGVG